MSDVTFPTPEEFSDWRRENPDRGMRLSPTMCPLAQCLRDRGADACVGADFWVDFDSAEFRYSQNWQKDAKHDLPEWAMDWRRAFDRGREINPPVPAEVDAPELVPA